MGQDGFESPCQLMPACVGVRRDIHARCDGGRSEESRCHPALYGGHYKWDVRGCAFRRVCEWAVGGRQLHTEFSCHGVAGTARLDGRLQWCTEVLSTKLADLE